LKLITLLEVVKYSLRVKFFSARGRSGGACPLNLNFGPPIISESTAARKLKLKVRLDMVKYLLWIPEFFR